SSRSLPVNSTSVAVSGVSMMTSATITSSCLIRRLAAGSTGSAATSDEPGRLIEQHVDEDAGDRDIEPDRKRPAGDAPVLRVARLQTARQGDDRERQHREGERDVRDQDAEVDGPDDSLPGEPDRSDP